MSSKRNCSITRTPEYRVFAKKKKLEGTGSELQAVALASPLRESDGYNDNDDNDTRREHDPTYSQTSGPTGMSDGAMTPPKKTLLTFQAPALWAKSCLEHHVDDSV